MNPGVETLAPAAAVDLADFAAKAKAAARTVRGKGRFGEKVFIAQAHTAYVRVHGPILLADFKELLGKSLQARHLNLSRVDQIEAFDEHIVAASAAKHPLSDWSFHFLDLE